MSLTRTERNDLVTLARRRARVATNDAKARAATLKAEIEESLAREFSSQDQRWKAEVAAAQVEINKVRAKIVEHLTAEGVPEQFHPYISLGWSPRGENSVNERCVELRKVATARIDEMLKLAVAEIERSTVTVETDLLLATSSETAREYLMGLPTSEALLPDAAAPAVVAELMGGGETR